MVLAPHIDEAYFKELERRLSDCHSDKALFEAIVNAPFYDKTLTTLLGLGITVLLLVDPKTAMINRIALSRTELAKGTTDITVKPFRSIKIPLAYRGNFIAEAIRSGRYQQTSDWQYLFAPALSPAEARLNQAGGGIACSFIYPLIGARSGGAMIFSYFITLDRITTEHRSFMNRYSHLAARVLNRTRAKAPRGSGHNPK